eukprot:TRINITY_DN4652_c0_g1_i1.p1 TRINITY_DN4652_c0_g1~~TRINITY_DN4652_c0_g1_i1.p1  ORF type:complete len:402 (-),score=103.02 TRINITY_DN4652_c0_g1_i1:250-1455(-)
MYRGPKTAKIIGVGMTKLGKFNLPANTLMQNALGLALNDARMTMRQLGGVIAIPSLSHPHFMEAHYLATRIGLLPAKVAVVRTIDTGGAGPISGLLEAVRMIKNDWAEVVAVVAGDSVLSLPRDEFLKRADQSCSDPEGQLQSPVIPHGYDKVAQWHMEAHGTTREQLAMCSALMSHQATRHPMALTKKISSVQDVLNSAPVAPVTSTLECARRADGGAAIIVASSHYLARNGFAPEEGVVVLGGGEGSGPLFPPPIIDEDMFSCEEAAKFAFEEAHMGVSEIDFFGLYDCFPICLIRAIEAIGLAPKGEGGKFIESKYQLLQKDGLLPPQAFPINTHGGLLAFGAPWEVPAMYNIVEAVLQLRKKAGKRQLPKARHALVYGNGGIFSASAVAILGDGKYW